MSDIILKNDLFEKILLEPARECDELRIVSGFSTPAMVVHNLTEVEEQFAKPDLKIQLIIGMTPTISGISKTHHKNFTKLVANRPNFVCSYIKSDASPIHTKLYTWLRNGVPQKAFLASANYTINAFKKEQDEIATECDPVQALEYFNSKVPLSLYCTCDEAEEMVREDVLRQRVARTRENSDEEQQVLVENSGVEGQDTVSLPLFVVRENRIHTHSGLNWGQRDRRNPNQAYIPIPAKIGRSGFFPPRGQPFAVLTSDGFPFVCVVAQGGDKAIHTTNNNSEFGEYFRRRLGVPLGAPITLDDLDRFGNRYVKFTKINEEEYYMEFNPN
ncbi:MAG: NgoFVII family restriction endonuclease [Alphaproteobacteria bacterium]|nr:NgoFVII family restriction endonuclease [Alphaproteobacteria bacterium]